MFLPTVFKLFWILKSILRIDEFENVEELIVDIWEGQCEFEAIVTFGACFKFVILLVSR